MSRHFRARMRDVGSGACAALCSSQLLPLLLTLLLRFPTPSSPRPGYQRVVRPGEPCAPRAPGSAVVYPALAMDMEQVNALCEELVKAVTVMMDPSSTQRYRLEALKVAGVLAPWACPETPHPRPPRRPFQAHFVSRLCGHWTTHSQLVQWLLVARAASPLLVWVFSSLARLSLSAAHSQSLHSGLSAHYSLLFTLDLTTDLHHSKLRSF